MHAFKGAQMTEYLLILTGTAFVNSTAIVRILGLLIALNNSLNLCAEQRACTAATAFSSQTV
ncbi:MAG: hypothetical protein A3H31_02435 [Gallionellales bacterium RIFCSPLOWO2_02_FULL_57_47]|nr:MAG: hypothetical protein A3H31_02435 [Gallionellales bacterium RIFCSPLOWO2_02_FULL_57_47]OGT14869.1 MAG: hypothetical protein A3J49_02030 [Gallionellales bacterium RIFCSPHIGHO2_02_FULL_57_16]